MSPDPGYRAVVFDMDGVLVDSEPAFFDAVNDVLADEKLSIEFERYRALLGTSIEVTWRALIDMLSLPGDPDGYRRRFDAVLLDHLRRPRPPLPGVTPLLDALERQNVPFALATSSLRPWVDAVLESAGLQNRFQVMVTADAVQHEKPAPETYQRAAELLSIAPERCIAVEDTPPGIASARAAGMYAVQVRAATTAFPPIDGAHLVIDSLEAFPLAMLRAG